MFSNSSTYPTIARFRLFALIIGINEYPMLNYAITRALRGAVEDALEFKNYFEHTLGVSTNQITLLINEQATYSRIIQAMNNFRTDTRIRQGDAIVIFFAGHGTEIRAPRHWEVGNPNRMIQSLVPYDCDMLLNSGETVTPIPDYTINNLLRAIADKLGNNITVILDCCHAASGTRSMPDVGGDEAGPTARSVDLLDRDYSSSLDQSFLHTDSSARGGYRNPKFAHHGLGSHVLLAACSAEEQAWEEKYDYTDHHHGTRRVQRGQFSMALLDLFRSQHPSQLRYLDILTRLEHIPNQNPQCEGLHKDRFLFDGVISSAIARHKSFEVKHDEGSIFDSRHPKYIVMAGTIQGITNDSAFTVYYVDDMRTPIGVLYVERLQPSYVSTRPYSAYPPFKILSRTGSKAVAIQTRFGRKPRLYVWIDPTSRLSAYLEQITARYKELENVRIVSERRNCNIEITMATWQQINFKYSASSDILRRPSIFSWNRNSGMDILPYYLIRAAKFYGELKREANDSYISNGVRVNFFKLNHTASCPESNENMLRSDGVVNIEMSAHSSNVPYGVKLINKTNLDLHVYMFFMINSGLRIRSHFMPTDSDGSPYSVDPPLRRKSSLAIGWGDAGYTPLSFKLEGGQLFDVDFLKIFLTTQPVDLSCLVEDTPLDMVARKPKLSPWVPPTSSWSHIIVPVIQRLVS